MNLFIKLWKKHKIFPFVVIACIVFLAVFGVAISKSANKLGGDWITFVFFFLFIPISLYFNKIFLETKDLTREKQKILNRNTIYYILLFELCDLLYMTIFLKNYTWMYILGVVSIIIIFNNLVNAFIKGLKVNAFFLISDFVLGLGLTIYLIYTIPEDFNTLQKIITTVVSAVYGGLITLTGVAWTIKNQEKNRKQEEIKKARPLFIINRENNVIDDTIACNYCGLVQNGNESFITNYTIENSGNSSFIIDSIYKDYNWCKTNGSRVLLQNKKLLIKYKFENVTEMYLKIIDALSNQYFYKIKFDLAITSNGKVNFYVVKDYIEVPKEDLIKNGIIQEILDEM